MEQREEKSEFYLAQPKVDHRVTHSPTLEFRYNGYPSWVFFGPNVKRSNDDEERY